nr:transglutaminase domain-containing protein [Clostridia bacterium]
MNPDVGLLEFGTKDKAVKYDEDLTEYHEGIVTTSWFNFNKEYRAVTMVPSYRNTEFDDELARMIEYYELMNRYIFMYHDVYDEKETADVIEFVNKEADAIGYDYYKPSMIERYYKLNEEQRMMYIVKHYNISKTYSSYVESYYTRYPESEALQAVVNEIFSGVHRSESLMGQKAEVQPGLYGFYFDPETGMPYRTTHDMVMKVIDYLSENYTYSLTPIEPTRKKQSALDAFLADTKQGYCVQFATSAAMILRSVGIPTRYVEGYIASDFTRNTDKERIANYSATVHDYDAHAWIEVWVEGFGWMQYEVTPSYYDSMYKPLTTSISTSRPSGSYTEEPYYEEEPIEETPVSEPEYTIDFSMFIPLIIALIVLAVIGVIVMLLLRFRERSRLMTERRLDILGRAMASPDRFEAMVLARDIGGYIMQLLGHRGLAPETGELPGEFARRVESTLGEFEEKHRKKKPLDLAAVLEETEEADFGEVMHSMQKAEFAGNNTVISSEELKNMAVCFKSLSKRIAKQIGPIRRLWLKNVRNLI